MRIFRIEFIAVHSVLWIDHLKYLIESLERITSKQNTHIGDDIVER
jgi:hypothetical protein